MAAKKTARTKKATKGVVTKKASSGATPKKAAAKKSGRKGPRGPRSGSKTAFILSQPMDAPAKDVVEAGAKAGHEFDVRYVYSIRSSAKSKGGQAVAPKSAPSTPASPVAKRGPGRPRKIEGATGSLAASGSLESQFARLAVDIGVARAEAILRKVRDQLDRMTF